MIFSPEKRSFYPNKRLYLIIPISPGMSVYTGLNQNEDYHPFGMLMPGRNYSSSSSRAGFNGKEQDAEVSGTGNSYDYGFRIYNPRIARFLSVDPLTSSYPWYTPYQFAGNKPIWAIDLDGQEEQYFMIRIKNEGNKSYLESTETKKYGGAPSSQYWLILTDQNGKIHYKQLTDKQFKVYLEVYVKAPDLEAKSGITLRSLDPNGTKITLRRKGWGEIIVDPGVLDDLLGILGASRGSGKRTDPDAHKKDYGSDENNADFVKDEKSKETRPEAFTNEDIKYTKPGDSMVIQGKDGGLYKATKDYDYQGNVKVGDTVSKGYVKEHPRPTQKSKK